MSVIELYVSVFDWAQFRQTKGAVKLNLLLDHDGYLPAFALVTSGNVHDVQVAQLLGFRKVTSVAMDRGYLDYGMFGKWTTKSVYFMTHLKSNARYQVVEEQTPPQRSNVRRDCMIGLNSGKAGDHLYRLVVVWDEKIQK